MHTKPWSPPIPGHQSDTVICSTKQEKLYKEQGRHRESKAQTQKLQLPCQEEQSLVD